MKKQREHWSSSFGFIMAAAGAAIGLGTLWMFPYLTGQNGGGLFVLIYLFAMFFVGFPIFIAELVLGRAAQRAPVGIFASLSKDSAGWKMVGWLSVLGALFIMSYYSVVAGWGLNYIGLSLAQFTNNKSPAEITAVFDVLSSAGDITIFWHFIFMVMTTSVVYLGVRNGVEYWSRLMTTSLLVLLLALFCFSCTLPGFSKAFEFIFYPDASKLKPSAVLEALGLAFFTLSLGQGVMLTYGSYMKKSDNIPQTAAIVVVMDVIVSLLSAMVIFPMIFSFGFEPDCGPGLVFKVLPVVFSQLPCSSFLMITFFTLFVFTALTSSISIVEVIVANTIDLFDCSRKHACIIVGLIVFLMGIPSALSDSEGLFSNWKALYGMNYFDVMSTLVSNWILPVGGMLTATFIGWAFPKERCYEEFISGSHWRWLFRPWFFMVRWVAPLATILIIFYKSGLIDVDLFWGSS
jgi:NSS family neurotransmitter:Na+ symporter